MKVHELIALLKNRDANDDIVIAVQPHYPLEYYCAGVATSEDMNEEDDEPDDESAKTFIVVGDQIGYGKRAVWDNVRRR